MVKDKFQARSKGPIDCLTRQPIKGRKKGGGIRLGEMERDALIAHGVSEIIKERLLLVSDSHDCSFCQICKTFLTVYTHGGKMVCKTCFENKQE